jgi:hypothetical protein
VWKATKEVAIGFAVSSTISKGKYAQPFVIGYYPPLIAGQQTLNVFNTNGKAGFDLTTTTQASTTNVRW